MRQTLTKITLVILCCYSILSCNTIKRVGKHEHLLTKNTVYVNDKKINNETLNNLIYQKPNSKLLGYPLRLHIYNAARENRDSLFEAWLDKNPKRRDRLTKNLSKKQLDKLKQSALGFNNWLRKTGEAPVIVDTIRTRKTKERLSYYHFSNGWFDNEVDYIINKKNKKKATIDYKVVTKEPYLLDSISYNIKTPIIDSLYQFAKDKSIIKSGNQFKAQDQTDERERLTKYYRNSGVYHFSQDYIRFENDTIGLKNKVNVEVQIEDRIIRNEDSVARVPFKIYTIKEVNIITDNTFENQNNPFRDSTSYEGYNLYSYGTLKYKPKALTDAIFINKGNVFRDIDRVRTYRYLNELKTFKYPQIDYIENPLDTTLIATISLTPRKKYGLSFETSVSQSNIQSVGLSFSTSLFIRNVFRGAEILQLSAFGAIGASKDGSGDQDQFFDINELGADVKLSLPRFFFPFKTEKIIPKYMSPSTNLSLGFTSQTNIGLDKQTVNSVFNYRWLPSQRVTNSFDLFNIQYIRNLNVNNYFNVYRNSYNSLNDIAVNTYNTPSNFLETDELGNTSLIEDQADNFINTVIIDSDFQTSDPSTYQTVNNIEQRKQRLTEDNLILSSSFEYAKDKRENLFDKDFSIFRIKLELAGNLLASTSNIFGLEKNTEDRYELFGVAYSQYAKTEFDYIKHWSLGRNKEFAIRTFLGVAIPFGNSSSIPFSKSFFAGGANDNRAWTAYDLGPGSSLSNNEFNEANMKIALNMEYRYKLLGRLNGAFFIDVGNIWNVADDEEDTNAQFNGIKDLKDIAIGSGFGLRYDFSLFILRFDIGFKTYDPIFRGQNRWFNNYNFSNAVYNIGINYPF